MSQGERIVVVGAGLAGLRAAERLRELSFEGELVIVGSERVAPYHRPALSKQLLMGAMRPNDLMLPAYRDIGARWRLGTQAAYLLPRNRIVRLPGAEELHYDGLIIATGVEAKRPNDVPYHDPRIVLMRTLSDALDLERALGAHRGPVAVVGGGFTGCEIAASLRHLGREVTIIGRGKNLLGNVLGPQLGEWLTKKHRDHGVDLALGNSVKQWAPGPDGVALQLSDGSTMVAACVVIAAGTEPCTTWLRGSGLPLDNGVVCEPTCHVVGAEDVVAAGDVAQWPNLRFDEVPRRVEHWLNAVEMGRAAAESLIAGRAAAEPFTPMPRFWTEQYGVRIQAGGVPKLGTETISLGRQNAGTGTVVGYVKDGRLMGVVGVDCPAAVLSLTDTVAEQNPVPQKERPSVVPSAEEPRQEPATSTGTRNRKSGRHALPTETKRAKSGRSSGRLRPVESNPGMRPVEPDQDTRRPAEVSARLSPVASNPGLHPVGSNPRMRPAASSTGLHPAQSNPGMRPVASNPNMQPVNAAAPRPMDSSVRMGPVQPVAPTPSVPPIPSVPPAHTGARMRPVPPPARPPQPVPPAHTGTRMRPAPVPPPSPTETTAQIPVVGADGRQVPVDTHGRFRPVDVSMRFRPVPPPGAPELTGRIPLVEAHSWPPPPAPDMTSRIPVVDAQGRIRPVDANGNLLPPHD
jgi:NADPH-dependent 2,4-dienoyl-CoA reductase/sulfur reductase-like enzyme